MLITSIPYGYPAPRPSEIRLSVSEAPSKVAFLLEYLQGKSLDSLPQPLRFLFLALLAEMGRRIADIFDQVLHTQAQMKRGLVKSPLNRN